jgi:peptide/nickel transport system substrate-binding protein
MSGRRNFAQLLLLACVLFTACAAPTSTRQEVTLRVRIGSDITNLDPAFVLGIESQTVASHIYNGLLRYNDQTNALEPDLAERWEVGKDGRSYTFFLRSGVRWQQGFGEFTAEDVRFSLERIRSETTASRYRGEYANIVAVEVADSLTVRIQLAEPDSGFLYKVAAFAQGMLVSSRAVTERGEGYALNPVGTGPFMFEEHLPGQQVSLVLNPNYFGQRPAIDRIIFRVIRDEQTAELALRNGEIDILFALQSPDVIERLRKDTTVVVQERPANNTVNLVLNTTVRPLEDRRVRQAIAHAINREAMVTQFFRGLKTPADTLLTPNFAAYTSEVPRYPYDPQAARSLLVEAGATDLQLELYSVALYPYDQIVVLIADDLRRAGIETTIQVLDRAAYNEVRAVGTPPMIITAIIGPPDPANVLWKLSHSSSMPPGLNTAHYQGADTILEQARAELNEERQIELYRKAQQQIMTDLPMIPLYTDLLVQAARKNVENLPQNALFTLSLEGVRLAPGQP